MLIEWYFYDFWSLFTTFFSFFTFWQNGQNQLLAKKQVTFALFVLFILFHLLKLRKVLCRFTDDLSGILTICAYGEEVRFLKEKQDSLRVDIENRVELIGWRTRPPRFVVSPHSASRPKDTTVLSFHIYGWRRIRGGHTFHLAYPRTLLSTYIHETVTLQWLTFHSMNTNHLVVGCTHLVF